VTISASGHVSFIINDGSRSAPSGWEGLAHMLSIPAAQYLVIRGGGVKPKRMWVAEASNAYVDLSSLYCVHYYSSIL
jgi:hypothetical protein